MESRRERHVFWHQYNVKSVGRIPWNLGRGDLLGKRYVYPALLELNRKYNAIAPCPLGAMKRCEGTVKLQT